MSHHSAQGKLGRQEVRHRSTIKKNLVNFQNKRPPADYMLCLSNAHCVILRYFYIFKYSPWQEWSNNMSSKYLKITFKKNSPIIIPSRQLDNVSVEILVLQQHTALLTHRLCVQLCWLQRSSQRKCKNVLGYKGQEDNFSLF